MKIYLPSATRGTLFEKTAPLDPCSIRKSFLLKGVSSVISLSCLRVPLCIFVAKAFCGYLRIRSYE